MSIQSITKQNIAVGPGSSLMFIKDKSISFPLRVIQLAFKSQCKSTAFDCMYICVCDNFSNGTLKGLNNVGIIYTVISFENISIEPTSVLNKLENLNAP